MSPPEHDAATREMPAKGRLSRAKLIVLATWAAVCLLPLLVSIWPSRPYTLDLASQFAVHGAVAMLAIGAVLAVLRLRRAGLAAAVGGALLLGWAWWWSAGAAGGAVVGRAVKVVHFNAHSEVSANNDAFKTWLRGQDADLVCLIETPWSFAAQNPWVREMYPYRVEPSVGLDWPNLLLSKFPLELTTIDADNPDNMFSFVARRSVTVVFPDGGRLFWTAMHPPSPRRAETWDKALASANRDAALLKRFRNANPLVPMLVTGDFNSSPTGRLHQEFARESGLKGWTALLGSGTWPSTVSRWFGVPIDRIWTSPEVVVRELALGPDGFKSDHRGVAAVVDVMAPIPSNPAGKVEKDDSGVKQEPKTAP